MSLAAGDPSSALVELRRAISVWQSLEAPYEVAQLRVLLSSACGAFDDDEAARLELEAAHAAFAALGAGDLTWRALWVACREPRTA